MGRLGSPDLHNPRSSLRLTLIAVETIVGAA
jgi:hypothetical protein